MKHLLLAAACALPLPALSDPARVTAVEVAPGAEGWTFRVTISRMTDTPAGTITPTDGRVEGHGRHDPGRVSAACHPPMIDENSPSNHPC